MTGFIPRFASRIALSTACTLLLSQTFTEMVRGSGTDTVATWLSGIFEP